MKNGVMTSQTLFTMLPIYHSIYFSSFTSCCRQFGAMNGSGLATLYCFDIDLRYAKKKVAHVFIVEMVEKTESMCHMRLEIDASEYKKGRSRRRTVTCGLNGS